MPEIWDLPIFEWALDDVGDEAELDYIIEQGLHEAAEWFGEHGDEERPAKWLNPPHPER